MSEFLYVLEDLVFTYSLGSQKIEALRHLNLTLPKSRLITLSGPSGSGKSTLLNILGLIDSPDLGRALLNGQDILKMSEREKNIFRKFHIGFIFQKFHLIPVLSVWENIGYFLSRHPLAKKERQERIEEALVSVDLWDQRFKRPSELSGGQRQRVAIARALAKKPSIIIGDEPTACLDQKTGQGIMAILYQLIEEQKQSVIIATHDPMVQSFAYKNFTIQDGCLV